jgi:hypothetical protein
MPGPGGRDVAEPKRFLPRQALRSSGPEPAVLRASVCSTEASDGRLVRVGVLDEWR